MRFFEIRDQMLSYYPSSDSSLLEKAYIYVASIHRGRVRLPGEPYLNHSLAVAGILAQMRLDEESIASGLLHDVVEDKYANIDEVRELFGPGVAGIVQGVTKLSRLSFSSREERQAEYIRKMILAMSQDVRVILVKLADRLHDMRSLHSGTRGSGNSMAQETFDIYAPLAARLGIDWMKQELEDLAFRCKEPESYEEILGKLEKTQEERRRYIEDVMSILNARLEEHGIKGRVNGRSKHLHSIYQKMIRQNLDLNRVYDIIAFRIIVDSVKACYEALAMIHALWEPVQGRFKDYIVKPKSNMYQSLHTTVIGPYHERMEVQIRTEEMNRIANEGIAAHWLYKEGRPLGKIDEQETQRFSWLRELMEWNKDWRDPKTFFDAVKVNFYPDEVYVFTPQGEIKSFPRGSTPVDFAYEVHTEVGHRCVGARVNGKLVQLRYELQTGDTIEILTAANHRPSKDWLKQVKTSKAINRIRHWFKAEERERSISLGREFCEREFRKKGLNFHNYLNSNELLEAARGFSLRSVDDLLAAVGYRKVSPVQVIGKLPSKMEIEEAAREDTIPVEKRRTAHGDEGVKVRGVDDVMIRMAKCCNPVPGEEIVGYITRGRGITVHRVQCNNIGRGDAERKIDVQWDSGGGQVYPVDIKITHASDKGILAGLSAVLGQLDANVVDIQVEPPGGYNLGACRLKIEVKDTKHLQRVLSALRAEKGVYRVQRSME
ncbi:RelA/SpoT family protein [Syntrophobacter fumaroxidans]|uniref:(P)ppGpp synthetase I, SpoT/RelA n=1 Tax=Syntrophobacter fumaroxidans (strain DSM 10017 / MPOB) TaxID=335543 RepID=A0LK42_SYNFM|nr:bifunctional (p)ppGpp synthetase/guanosine-3',5'-bis(diphosphate) 3'-pyrophosphohydrolase [Syntrophobacter fumaroxidans]ABK17794.1 (p)ppGpp synthetase I, SpoT/RelA [Syntrophobacter fumaroxidans MPOB]